DYAALSAFFQTNGFTVSATHPNRVVLDVNGSVADIEKLFHLTLRTYQHPTEKRTLYSPDLEPSLALDVRVLDISGLNNFALPRPASLHPVPSSKTSSATPQDGSAPGGAYLG